MRIYFVRHGSTDAFERLETQRGDEPLNAKGREQAKQLADRFSDVKLDTIVSSSYTRAVETATFIGKDFIVSPLFTETKKPSEIVGLAYNDPKSEPVLKKVNEKFISDPSWHYSDEENFEDLIKRGKEAIEFLKSQNKENVLVISHGNFICFLVTQILFGNEITPQLILKTRSFMRLGNTGVSILTYENDKWHLEAWNDTSHFLE
jgi:broad specificity phosphatase PhoE